MKTTKFFSKKVSIYSGIGVVLILVIVFSLNKSNGKQIATVVRADIVAEVAATGKVKPNQNVDLGFDKAGRVKNVYASVGDIVKKGQTIATLESGESSANLDKARASLLQEQIILREMKSTAPVSYNDASKNLDAAVREGFASADDAVRNKADQFFKNPATTPQFGISITSGNFVHYFNVPIELTLEINSERKDVENVLIKWQKEISNLNSSNLVSEADNAISSLNTISIFLDKVAEATNTFTSVDYAYDTTVSNYKLTISGARSGVSGAISAIVAAKTKLTAAPTLGENGQFENVSIQEAIVAQAQAAVSSLESSLSKSAITAPFDGIVTLQDAKVGAAVSAGTTLISVASQDKAYIEANISEIHIGKIMLGNPTSITFDAFPGEEFSGEVFYIEPGDVVIDGIVNYKIRVNISNPDVRIKNGLTTNLKIQTDKKSGVLAIPLYSISKENDKNFMNKLVGGKTQKTYVNLGLSGNDGLVEILSGLSLGDTVEF
jgi:multidrug efflux pump subunit AcrA (membrane-fusion protein)